MPSAVFLTASGKPFRAGAGGGPLLFQTAPATGQVVSGPAPTSIPLGMMAHGANVTTPMHTSRPGFAKGQVSTATKLVGTIEGNTIELQMDGESYWSDGSVRSAYVTARLPVNLVDGVEKVVTVTPTAGAPNRAALITPSALVAAKDIKLRHYGGDCGSDVYETSVREIVTNMPQDVWGTNPLGGWDVPISGPQHVMVRAWRCWKRTSDSGYDKWRKDTVYLSYRIDGTYEVAARCEQSNWDVAVAGATLGGTTQHRCAHFAELYDGTTRVQAWGGPNDVRATSVAASAFNTTTNVLALSGDGWAYGQALILTGTVPSGLTANTPYWIFPVAGGIKLYASRRGMTQIGDAALVFGTAGSGTITVQPLYVSYPGAGPVLMATDGLPVMIGGTRPNVTSKWDELYMSKWAKMFPCYSQTFTRHPSSENTVAIPQIPYYPNQMPWGPWLNGTGDGGADNRIGYINPGSLRWLLLPHDTGWAQLARQQAAGWSDQPLYWTNPTTGRIICNDNGPNNNGTPYPQMGACRPAIGYNYQDNTWIGPNGGGSDADGCGYFDGYSYGMLEPSHMPAPWVVPAHMTGHPVFTDMGRHQAHAAQLSGGSANNVTVSGTVYYNCIGAQQQTRGTGWLLRAWSYAELFTPAALPEAAYIKRAMDTTAAWGAAYVGSNPAGLNIGYIAKNNGALIGDEDRGFHHPLWGLALATEAWRADRSGFTLLARAHANYCIGILNDANPLGGTGYEAEGGYFLFFTTTPGGNTPFANIRAMIGGLSSYHNATAPFPTTGFNTADGNTPYHDPAYNVLFLAATYSVLNMAYLGMCASAGLVSLNGDIAVDVYNAMYTRFNTAPLIGGPKFEGYDRDVGHNIDYGKNAIVPAPV